MAEEEEPVVWTAPPADEATPLLGRHGEDRAWWKRPHPAWLFVSSLIMACSFGAVIAPKFEIYNALACRALIEKPEAISTQSPWLLLEGLDMDTCRHDARVQRAVTELNVALTLAMGLLSALTAGFWGALSDRRGRRGVLALTQLGFLLSDAVFLTVVVFTEHLSYKLLFLGPAIDGLFGGWATAQACLGAYISDCTPPGSRANVFGMLMALIFAGFAVGPTFGALLIALFESPLAPFWAAAGCHGAHFLAIGLFLPESRTTEAMAAAQERYDKEIKVNSVAGQASLWARAKQNARATMAPLIVFLPRQAHDIGDDQRAVLRPVKRRSWALTIVGVVYNLSSMAMAIYPVKMQYAQFRFGWGPRENGYLLTLSGVARCIVLLFVLPVVTKMLRTKPSTRNADGIASDQAALRGKMLHDSHFDLVLGRGSLALDILGYSIIVLSSSPTGFIVGTALAAFGVGASPAIQSLALTLSSPDDSGRVLAALGVCQSLSGQILGPLLFNAAFAVTIEWFAPAVFVLCLVVFGAALIALVSLRLARRRESDPQL